MIKALFQKTKSNTISLICEINNTCMGIWLNENGYYSELKSGEPITLCFDSIEDIENMIDKLEFFKERCQKEADNQLKIRLETERKCKI